MNKYDYVSPSLLQVYNQNKKVLSGEFKSVGDLGVRLMEHFKEDEVIKQIVLDEKSFIQIIL